MGAAGTFCQGAAIRETNGCLWKNEGAGPLTSGIPDAIISINQQKWLVNPKNRRRTEMKHVFEKLLRSNFRCGRMLYSRTVDMAGCFGAPTDD